MLLSQSAQSLWAKTDPMQELHVHMNNSARNAQHIWRTWVSHGAMDVLTLSCHFAEHLFVFLAAAHDLGKATPVFQLNPRIPIEIREAVLQAGLPQPKRMIADSDRKRARHSLATQAILEQFGVDTSVAVVVGGHHGKPPSEQEANSRALHFAFGFKMDQWDDVQKELFEYALHLSQLKEADLLSVKLTIPQQMLLSGLVILADWISSSAETVTLPDRWILRDDYDYEDAFFRRFHFNANPLQLAVIEKATRISKAGICVIEAPMGCGKTEAALFLAESFASESKRTGVYFALPSRATADGILSRYINWIHAVADDEPHALVLAHRKASQNKQYNALRHLNIQNTDGDTKTAVFVHEWLAGRKLQMLAGFAIGTIDQLLMGALRHKFLALRHLGFANKVVIIDEVHAYDAYMDSYLYRMLTWLGMYHVPVVVLSATLPVSIRKKLVEAYMSSIEEEQSAGAWEESQSYPLLTYTDGNAVKQYAVSMVEQTPKIIEIECFDGDIGAQLEDLLGNGGCACVIVNTVKRAQAIAQQLAERFGAETVFLLHSRFIAVDRAERERKLLEKVGKNGDRPGKWIVVGTQVVEQSLDIDFDVLLTDCCPMDLLLQRIGRLHRHTPKRSRPARLLLPKCYVMQTQEIDKGSGAVYGAYSLLCTRYLLPKQIVLPDDIAPLVHQAYSDHIDVPETELSGFIQAKAEQKKVIADKESKACAFQLASPIGSTPNLLGWLDYSNNGTDQEAEASVRDSSQSIEVLLIQKVEDRLRLLPWIQNGSTLPIDRKPEQEVAYDLSCCSISLPAFFSASWAQHKTITALEQHKEQEIPGVWDESHWLRGMLYLILDEHLETVLCGKKLSYRCDFGLIEGGE